VFGIAVSGVWIVWVIFLGSLTLAGATEGATERQATLWLIFMVLQAACAIAIGIWSLTALGRFSLKALMLLGTAPSVCTALGPGAAWRCIGWWHDSRWPRAESPIRTDELPPGRQMRDI
jgi:hypothetical protein